MLLSLFLATCLSYESTITATDNKGKDIPFPLIQWKGNSKMASIQSLTKEQFENGKIVTFKIIRKDGLVLDTPAPHATKNVAFSISSSRDTPVGLDATSSMSRKGHQASLNRARVMPEPHYDIQATYKHKSSMKNPEDP